MAPPAVPREPEFEILLDAELGTTLFGERLRDGRIALGTRSANGRLAGEMHLLPRAAYLALAAWLADAVHEAWLGTVREHLPRQAATAEDLYGPDDQALQQFGADLLAELPPGMLARALILLLNSLGPQTRERLVARLNRTSDRGEEAGLRRRLLEQQEHFAYAVAAAAVYDALAHGDEPV